MSALLQCAANVLSSNQCVSSYYLQNICVTPMPFLFYTDDLYVSKTKILKVPQNFTLTQ